MGMTFTINLPSDIEAAVQARAHGLDLPQHVEHVLRERAPLRAEIVLSPAERAQAWRESARGLPHTVPLSYEALSRGHMAGRELS